MAKIKFAKFFPVLRNAWTIDTTPECYRERWTRETPAVGQCAVTALLVNDYFGGEIYSGITQDKEHHFWNVVQGHRVDLTKSQLPDDVEFHKITRRDRELLLKIEDLQNRYFLLKKNFEMESASYH